MNKEYPRVYVTVHDSIGGWMPVVISRREGPLQSHLFKFSNPGEAKVAAKQWSEDEDIPMSPPLEDGKLAHFTTCCINKKHRNDMRRTTLLQVAGWEVFDITVGSGGDAAAPFAPSWDIVRGHQEGLVSDDQYTEEYLKMMRISFKKNPQAWRNLLDRASKGCVALACYCKRDAFCHRHILMDILKKVGKSWGYAVVEDDER